MISRQRPEPKSDRHSCCKPGFSLHTVSTYISQQTASLRISLRQTTQSAGSSIPFSSSTDTSATPQRQTHSFSQILRSIATRLDIGYISLLCFLYPSTTSIRVRRDVGLVRWGQCPKAKGCAQECDLDAAPAVRHVTETGETFGKSDGRSGCPCQEESGNK